MQTLFLNPNYPSLRPKLNVNEPRRPSAPTANQTQIPKTGSYQVKFTTHRSCQLGISRYPNFEYDARGGSGLGSAHTTVRPPDEKIEGVVSVNFDPSQLYIPPLTTATTRFLGLPLPPFFKIDIVPEAFRGAINRDSGKVELKFRARFCFSVGSVYKARPLVVDTILTSEESKGEIRGGKGERLGRDGTCRLVGLAKVEPINDIFIDTFLALPTECLAILNATISFSSNK